MFDIQQAIIEAQTIQDIDFIVERYSRDQGISYAAAMKECNSRFQMQEKVETFSRPERERLEARSNDQIVEDWNKTCTDADDAAEKLHSAALVYQKSEGITDYTKALRFVRHKHPEVAKLADSKPIMQDASVE